MPERFIPFIQPQRYIELNPVRAAMVQDPAHYRWSRYYANAFGRPNRRFKQHDAYLSLGRSAEERRHAYRALFRANLDQDAIADIRLAVNQNQPIGNGRFHAQIAQMVGAPREARSRGRPRTKNDLADATGASQTDLGL